jgi:hypothetical protein
MCFEGRRPNETLKLTSDLLMAAAAPPHLLGSLAASFGVSQQRASKGGGRRGEGHSVLGYTIGDTLTSCDPFGIPSTSHWTGAAIIV